MAMLKDTPTLLTCRPSCHLVCLLVVQCLAIFQWLMSNLLCADAEPLFCLVRVVAEFLMTIHVFLLLLIIFTLNGCIMSYVPPGQFTIRCHYCLACGSTLNISVYASH